MIGMITATPDGLTAYIRHLIAPGAKGRCLHGWSPAFHFHQDEDYCREALPAFLWGDGQAVFEELDISVTGSACSFAKPQPTGPATNMQRTESTDLGMPTSTCRSVF